MMKLEKPSNKLVSFYINEFNSDERYYDADIAIARLIEKFPYNNSLEEIILKVAVINELYSTNILGTYRMARHINSLDIDIALKKGDPSIVNKIASNHGIENKNKKELRFYSFATKYCNWHNQSKYAIYDGFISKLLLGYKKQDNFLDFYASELRDYEKFDSIVRGFMDYYKIDMYNFKELDKFLWKYGKLLFGRK